MLSAFKHKKSVSSSLFSPLLPLLPESLPKTDDKTSFITMELKAKAGGPEKSPKYKKCLVLFDEGSPQQWIDLQRDITEVWTQNALTTAEDRMAIIKTVLRGESLTIFETSIAESIVDEHGAAVALTMDMVTLAMTAITSATFPHRALENQKQWMRKVMRKPDGLSTRLTASALSRLNNCLPLFPGGSDASKFSSAELLEILECSLPYTWRQKFDLDGYVPTDGNRDLLIQHCEAIERNQPDPKEDKKEVTHSKGKKPAKHARTGSSSFQKKEPPFNCTQHGKNFTHNTANCYVLNNKAQKPTQTKTVKFTKTGLRQEINFLARTQDKQKVLDMYMTVLNSEKTKLNKRKVDKAEVPMDSDTDSENSIALIEQVTKAKKQKLRKNKLKKIQKDNEKTPEEINFLQKTYAMESDTSSEG